MRNLLTIILIGFILAGCSMAPHRGHYPSPHEDPQDVWGKESDEPTGPDGLSMQDKRDLDLLRQELALDFTKRLAETAPLTIRQKHIVQRPTFAVKYVGNPPQGLDLTVEEQTRIYQDSYIKGDTIIYATDLSKMTLILERKKDDEPYDYREITTTVPYGMCLDYITENLGNESRGYRVVKIECDQSELGLHY